MGITLFNCSNCGKKLKKGEKEMAEKAQPFGSLECAECQYHLHNGTRTISGYNKWLKGVSEQG